MQVDLFCVKNKSKAEHIYIYIWGGGEARTRTREYFILYTQRVKDLLLFSSIKHDKSRVKGNAFGGVSESAVF